MNSLLKNTDVPTEDLANCYDGHMDKECIAICDALNSLPGVINS